MNISARAKANAIYLLEGFFQKNSKPEPTRGKSNNVNSKQDIIISIKS